MSKTAKKEVENLPELNRLKEVLTKKKISQYRLAKDLGLNYVTVTRWANNKQQPTLERLYSLADHLGVTVYDLLFKTIPKK